MIFTAAADAATPFYAADADASRRMALPPCHCRHAPFDAAAAWLLRFAARRRRRRATPEFSPIRRTPADAAIRLYADY